MTTPTNERQDLVAKIAQLKQTKEFIRLMLLDDAKYSKACLTIEFFHEEKQSMVGYEFADPTNVDFVSLITDFLLKRLMVVITELQMAEVDLSFLTSSSNI